MGHFSKVTVDILQSDAYEGAISSIAIIQETFDKGFCMAISFVAFIMILVAMFRNVLAGAYCAFPKFWGKVDDAHKAVASTAWKDRFNPKNLQGISDDSLGNAIMRLVPNIKVLTDFEDNTVSPKSYWIRAIPQMLACIAIAAFIYNGFYRDTASIVVDFGSEMISRVVTEVDPVAVFDRFTGSVGRPDFASDDSEDPRIQLVNRIATSMYNNTISEYTDVGSKEAKRKLVNQVEDAALEWVAYIEGIDPSFVEGKEWKIAVDTTISYGALSEGIVGDYITDDRCIFTKEFKLENLLGTTTAMDTTDMYLRVRLGFESQAVVSETAGYSELCLHLPVNSTEYAISGETYYIRSTQSDGISLLNDQGDTVGTLYSNQNDHTIRVVMNAGIGRSAGTTLTLASKLTVSATGMGSHYITTVKFVDENSYSLSNPSTGQEGLNLDSLPTR